MEIYDYIGNYPEINSDSFYLDIYKKKEFNELPTEQESAFRSWQKIIARFISYWTLYNGLLVCHDTGTGKSGTAIAVFEGMRKNGPIHVMYVTHNETLIDNFKNEIILRSRYLRNLVFQETKDHDASSESFKRARNRVLFRENFSFLTYQTLSGMIQKKKEANPLDKPVTHLLIFDEAHHLVIRNFEEPDSPYRIIFSYLTSHPRKELLRTLLLTATPMRHEPNEIAPLLNLILPADKRLPTGEAFVDYFFESTLNKKENIRIYRWKPAKEEEFRQKIKGYVSVVRQNTDIRVEYVGEVQPPMRFYKLEINTMSEFQSLYYLQAWEKDSVMKKTKSTDGKSAFKTNSQQASLFVFPDGTYGEAGQKKYMFSSGKIEIDSTTIKKTGGFQKVFLEDTGLRIGTKYDDENLQTIASMSVIYANIIRQILDNPTEHVYIYCDKINGSGILVLTGLLKTFFEFSSLNTKNINWKEHKRRFLFLNEEAGIKDTDFQDLLKIFNDERNLYGEFCQVVIGTDKTKEGITLKRIRQIHITTPDWNFGKMYQAIGRGIRMFSHQDLEEEEKQVKIFFHCSVPSKDDEPVFKDSVDFQLYYRSELRDQNIKMVEYNLLVSAFDCELNKKINDRSNFEENSPECYYRGCEYICNGFEGINADAIEIDYSTYDAYYAIEKLKYCVERVSECLNEFPVVTFGILRERLADTFGERVLFESVQAMINNPIPVLFKNYKVLYLMRKEDVLFLVDDVTLPPDPFLSYYAIHPSFDTSLPFDKILEHSFSNQTMLNIFKMIGQYIDNPGDYSGHFIKLLESVPVSYLEKLLPIMMGIDPNETNKGFRFLKDVFFKDRLLKKDGEWYHFFEKTPKKFVDGDWVFTQDTEAQGIDHDDPGFVKKYITDNPVGLYGFYVNKKFKIRDIRDPEKIKPSDKKKETHGQECAFYKVKDLLEFLWILGARFPSTEPDDEGFKEKYKATGVLSLPFLVSLVKKKASYLKFMEGKTITNEQDAMRFYHYFHDMKRDLMCKEIENRLMALGLIVPPPLKKTKISSKK